MSTDKSSSQDSHGSIIKSTSIISAGTLSSRILGFCRDIILAKILGTGLKADAFFVALKIPNLFRDLVGEGATNSAVVPVFSEYLMKQKRVEFWRFVSVVLTFAMIVLSVITLLGIVLAPVIVRMIAPGFMANPEKLELTIRLTKAIFPYLILIGLAAYSMAILYTFRSFVAPAFSPCMLNISIIISALLSVRYLDEPVYGLAGGVIVGGILQLIVQLGPLFKTGFHFERPATLNHPGALQVGKLLLPRLFGAGVYQMTVLIDTFCASLATIVGVGGISAIYYSNRIIQFPMGVFSIALASAVLPTLSGLASNKDIDQLKKTLVFSIENIFFIMFPTSVIIMLLSIPIIHVLFERGQFDSYSTTITALALLFYAVGLFSFGGIKILVTAFHALQDTKTPVKVAALCLLINAVLNVIFMYPLKVGGIALASSIAATIDFMILFHLLERRLGRLDSGLKNFVIKILFSTIMTGALVQSLWTHIQISRVSIKLIVLGFAGFIFYFALCYILKVKQAQKIQAWVMEIFKARIR